MERLDTLPRILARNYREFGPKIAIRHKMLGIWKEYTWKDYYENVKGFSLGLVKLGLQWGEKTAIIGDNAPQWYWAEVAAMAAGGIVLGIDRDASPTEIRHFVDHSDATFVVARDQEQIDKLLEVKDELPKLKKVIYWYPRGVETYRDPILISFDAVKELGRSYEETYPGLFERNIEKGKGDDIALLCYTSADSSILPKAAMFAYSNIIRVAPGWQGYRPLSENDNYVSYVSPASFLEQRMGIAGGMLTPFVVNFPGERDTMEEDIREIGPAILTYPPQTLESMASMVQAKMEGASLVKRFVYLCALSVGHKTSGARLKGEGLNLFWRALYALANVILFRPLKDGLGMAHTRMVTVESNPPSPEAFRFFHAIGINLTQGYCLIECPVCTAQMPPHIRPDTMGQPVLGQEVKISPEREILIRGPCLFQGYYKDPKATQQKMRDGWLHTGDAGFMDETGQLILLGRTTDLIK
jgi:long-chain acyl-CoA synthetase